ncbi:MAG: hypothetical protein M1820_007584 [Bogoriella megaspora]|nr:MAG: hypothetical protein M1820_007584 [Bogoriella megaspora]
MPGTRRRPNAATEVVQEEEPVQEMQVDYEGGGTGQVKLRFKDSLSWKVGRAIPVAELLVRLEKLLKELESIEQDAADRETLTPVADELAHAHLLGHKDRGVRAYTACCLVEMFRLCAPDAPYTEKQLKDIFTVIASSIIPALADPSDPYNSQHLHVLISLVTVKSIVLVADLNASNQLITQIFTACFDVLSGSSKASSGEEIGKNVEYHMTGLLETIVDEAQVLPDQVVDIMLAQFLRADPRTMLGMGKGKKNEATDSNQSTLLLKQAPPAYNMAKNICNTHADKMGRHVGQYFSSVIMSLSGATDGLFSSKSRGKNKGKDADEEDALPPGPSEDDLKELQKAHRLARELWRATPDVLQNIVPQIEAELGTENEEIRLLATETMGDMAAGIGAAGLPPPAPLDPVAYPSQSVRLSNRPAEFNFLTTPNSPRAFNAAHSSSYQSLLSRRLDKSPRIRAVWTLAIGRIIMTSAGNVGLDEEDEATLLKALADMLCDSDDKVRLAAVETISSFPYQDIVNKLGKAGGVADQGSILYNLTDRLKDPKQPVHTQAMAFLGKVWGVASGAIAEGDERTHTLFAQIPSKILEAFYVNNLGLHSLIDNTFFESLIPLRYPPVKAKQANGTSQKTKTQINGDGEVEEPLDVDKIRVERLLLLVKDLEDKAKKVFFAFQTRQGRNATYMTALLKRFEEFNGGVVDKQQKDVKKQMNDLITYHAKMLPDPTKAAEDLHKFAKMHDRRCYALIRFCIAPESDYRKVQNAIKELTKRIEEATSGASVLETIRLLVLRASIIFYNISHVPAIMDFARTDEKGLGATAHEVLKDISTKNPAVFKTHVKDLCRGLEEQAPFKGRENDHGAVDTLKACAGFARKFPQEIPSERKFLQSMVAFATQGMPPKTAKHAVSVLMSGPKKEMHAKDLLKKCTENFEYGSDHFLSKLASISQLMLLASNEVADNADEVIDIAINKVLLKSYSEEAADDGELLDGQNEDLEAKSWALKILTNRIRGLSAQPDLREVAAPVYNTLNKLVQNHGEVSKNQVTPKPHKPALRLLAAQLLVKLSASSRNLNHFLTPSSFNALATVAQDENSHVRSSFVNMLMKYLGSNRLSSRFYVPIFLLAFEPQEELRTAAQTWLRARSASLQRSKDITMEMVFFRVLSCLAWHPDFANTEDDLLTFVYYIIFYLLAVATSENLPLIFHVAQRVKGAQDGIPKASDTERVAEANERLYIVSDLAQAVIRQFAEEKGWSLQAWPGRISFPADIFAPMPGHERAQEVATKQYLMEEIGERLENVVRAGVRGKKRKSDNRDADGRKKKIKTGKRVASENIVRPIKTPRKRRSAAESETPAPESSERRKSGRAAGKKSYVERDDSEDDRDMEKWDVTDDAAKEIEEDEQEGAEDAEMRDAKSEEPEPRPTKKLKGNGSKAKRKAQPASVNGRVTRSGRGKQEEDAIPISSDKESGDEEISDLSDAPDES